MYDLDGKPGSLLTVTNPKTLKGENHGVLTAIMHLAPAMLSGRNVCPQASAGCIASCLNTAGQGGMGLDENGLNSVQVARIQRTRWFQRDRTGFMAQLDREILAHSKRARRLSLIPAVRLNGTSDIPWEKFAFRGYANVFQAYPDVEFYDYTKWPLDKRTVVDLNYHLTFSLSERPDSEARAVVYLDAGMSVAVVFNGASDPKWAKRTGALPETYELSGMSYPVIDGDKNDLRFLDPAGTIVGLRAKGRAKHDHSGFVRHI